MVGFLDERKEANNKDYSSLINEYVRVFLPPTTMVGKLVYTDNDKTHLCPHAVNIGNALGDRLVIVHEKPAIIETHTIIAIQPLGVGIEYLEELVRSSEQKLAIEKELRRKELEDKGFRPVIVTSSNDVYTPRE
ncbi:hypothetical protein J4230_00300 [Candidatus Woesearchaeota archaeon]|nr:hypothetical protein [Candidatus Woesearchaeota archaeon]